MDYVLTRFRIRNIEQFKKELKEHWSDKHGMREAFLGSGMTLESMFIEETGNQEGFLFIYKRIPDHGNVRKVVANPHLAGDRRMVEIAAKYLDQRVDLHAIETFDLMLDAQ